MTIEEIVEKVYIPEPLVKASQQAHEVKVRNEIQKPTFAEVLLHEMAKRK